MSIHFHSIGGDRYFGGTHVHKSPTTPLLPEGISNNYEPGFSVETIVEAVNALKFSGKSDSNPRSDRGSQSVDSSEVVRHPAPHHVAKRTFWPFGTYKFHEVPPNFKEPHIFTGYRSPTSTPIECFKYCFTPNNEMMNVWTHFIPFVGTTWYLIDLWVATNTNSRPMPRLSADAPDVPFPTSMTFPNPQADTSCSSWTTRRFHCTDSRPASLNTPTASRRNLMELL